MNGFHLDGVERERLRIVVSRLGLEPRLGPLIKSRGPVISRAALNLASILSSGITRCNCQRLRRATLTTQQTLAHTGEREFTAIRRVV